jgi:enamine deaminase RidA (YjgF/YER057c/UK114 family)
VERQDVNPWEWSTLFGFSQAVSITAPGRVLFCSGQTAVGPDGAPPTTTDMGEQFSIALENLTTVLHAAGMDFTNIVKVTTYTTDVDEFLAVAHVGAEALGTNIPANTLIGVARLAFPELKLEIEAIAVS